MALKKHNSSARGERPPETCDDKEMTREEYLEWAKQRALKYLPADPVDAMTSMGSDLLKHPDLQGHAGLMIMPAFYGAHNDPAAVKRWIEGFN